MRTKLMIASAVLALMAGSSFAELVMDLDADTLSLADGASVSNWTDQTAYGNDAVQTNADSQPLYVASNTEFNSHATVSFDGLDDWLDLDGSIVTVDSFTLFLVGNFDVTGANQYMISAQGGSGDDRLRVATYDWGAGFMTRIGNTGDSNLGPINTNVTVIAVTGTADAWLDLGSKITVGNNTAGALNPSDFALGCYNDQVVSGPRDFLAGDIAEVRLYDSVLTDTEIETINTELYSTYNAVIPITVIAEYPDPDADLTTNDFPLALGGVLVDGTSAVDTNSIQLILDSNTVTIVAGDVVKTGTTTTVSHAESSLASGTHTLSMVYEGTSPASGPHTNTWSFIVKGEPGNRVYVDATTSNTEQWDGGGFTTFNPDGTGSNWTTRTGYGNDSQVFQSHFVSNSPMLKTTVSGLDAGTYKVYAYMWAAGSGADWRMAALTNSTSLSLYYQSDYPDTQTNLYVHYQDAEGADPWGNFTQVALFESSDLISNPFGTQEVKLANSDRRLVEIYLGTITGTEILVYVDDDINGTDHASRTWYDGIGYELIEGGGATLNPVIQSISIAGTTVSLQWTSETVATYKIMLKTNLSDSVWTPVKTGIAGGDPTTSDSVDVGSASQGFFRIEGE